MKLARKIAATLCLLAAGAFVPVHADGGSIWDEGVNERVVMVPKAGASMTVDLETTVYRPEGEGPFPLVVINHGKALGDPRFQARYRPVSAARYFLQRGYAVVVPMRQGFSRSTGNYATVRCNMAGNGRAQAEDVKAVLDYFTAQPWVDKDHILVVGQSHGGWTTLAFGTMNYPGVRALVNFAGGLRNETCAWRAGLTEGAASFGRESRVPSLWFYGENDSYFEPELARAMYERYVSAGGKARLVTFGGFGFEGHQLFAVGPSLWQPELSKFLATIGLPSEPQETYAGTWSAQALHP